ncbi:probable transcription factor At5g28040 [Prosopis cineraria]|uniref:probable transcription factor At5g28040 n=1 Tax=Prosopis cineraria TaxID=364024 RepID=UPI0024101760|nr:probable transcription factor At5g28040 [Prosopis cineraria]XP_054803290.1 probable transcription factor At5g28040 [Prosopis cineraria]
MLSPLVSWILASSPSSSSFSEEEEDNFVDDGDHYENVGENEHFLREAEELPSTSCAGNNKTIPVSLATAGADDSYIPNTDTSSRKRRRITHSYPRRQYQRLWTKQDEIELLKRYLDYIKQHRWATTSLQNDVTFLYDHIRPKFNKDFNKNQLVQKLRALKRKHKTVSNKINSDREVSHKSPQEEAIFEISERIWGNNRDKESSPDPDADNNIEVNSEEEDGGESGQLNEENKDIKRLVEETMRSCLSPLNINNATEGSALKLVEQYGSGEEGDDERGRKQRILELEAYLEQLELLQNQIKARIEELRSDDG